MESHFEYCTAGQNTDPPPNTPIGSAAAAAVLFIEAPSIVSNQSPAPSTPTNGLLTRTDSWSRLEHRALVHDAEGQQSATGATAHQHNHHHQLPAESTAEGSCREASAAQQQASAGDEQEEEEQSQHSPQQQYRTSTESISLTAFIRRHSVISSETAASMTVSAAYGMVLCGSEEQHRYRGRIEK